MPKFDVGVLIVYIVAVVALGCWFGRRSGSTREFTVAGGKLPGWAVGLSIFGTYLSSNTFLGVPGNAYATNWNRWVFSLSLLIAAPIAVWFFVPHYRRSGHISAYEQFEARFGPWARVYASCCYLLTQLSRTAVILFGVSLAMQALLGWPMEWLILGTGLLVTLYTLVGGIEAVIWTDVVQSVILTLGALLIAGLLIFGMPEGPAQTFEIATAQDKFSLGSLGTSVTESTFWVVLLYGLFINLGNFGIDQSYVQRYHTARSEHEAAQSVWLGALLYLPISALFFLIGTALFAYHTVHSDQLADVRASVEAEWQQQSDETTDTEEIGPGDIGDRALPHFIVSKLPTGLAGLLIAAIFAAAMSSIDTSLNSSATILLEDVYLRYVQPQASERAQMRFLYLATLGCGALGTGAALAMINIQSILDAWWTLQGVFAGGIVGLFLLSLLVRRAGPTAAATAVVAGVIVLGWLTLSPKLPEEFAAVRNPMHDFMTIVVGTTTIVLTGFLVALLVPKRGDTEL